MTFRFYLIDFQLDIDFSLPNFAAFFTIKSPSVAEKSVSQEKYFQDEQKPVAFGLK